MTDEEIDNIKNDEKPYNDLYQYLLNNGSALTAEENQQLNISIEALFHKTGRKIVI